MVGAGIIGRAYGVLGLGTSAFGVAGWREDALFWVEWAKLNPGEAGILIGAGIAMVATYLIWEVTNFIKWMRRSRPQGEMTGPTTQITVHGNYQDFRGATGEWHFRSDGPVEVVAPDPVPVRFYGGGEGRFLSPELARLSRHETAKGLPGRNDKAGTGDS